MITADKLLKLAKRIVSSSNIPEEESRSAIGRAYYSLYHETLSIILKKYSFDLIKNIEKSRGKPLKWYERSQLNSLNPKFLSRFNFHKILPDTLNDINKHIFAVSFKSFRYRRNEADYVLKSNITRNDANIIVNTIDGLITNMKSKL